ncbi:MAG: TMEM165/GDT1 family protein [Candidatus Competibacter sp.]|nr:TMEM165/GDT1 family protein [Candidatus Competibacter sp.]MDG4606968.1 TMEM165/GDT1 family protein [Candidatus Contendobacter sp.]HRD49940.1 TMEM165/GDT1 family protein [Candidatus Contendobacter sp.]
MSAFFITASTAFGLIALAELGDKTQLVCMTLAARHPPAPVLIGAVLAFAVLNLLAVLFGASIAAWVPEWVTAALVAVLFAVFGWRAWREADAETVKVEEKSGRSVLLSAFALIFLAELGDKTQLAVAGLASTQAALPVWIGGTLGLAATSTLGVLAGRTVLQRLPMHLLHRASGALFLLLAAIAGWRAFATLPG